MKYVNTDMWGHNVRLDIPIVTTPPVLSGGVKREQEQVGVGRDFHNCFVCECVTFHHTVSFIHISEWVSLCVLSPADWGTSPVVISPGVTWNVFEFWRSSGSFLLIKNTLQLHILAWIACSLYSFIILPTLEEPASDPFHWPLSHILTTSDLCIVYLLALSSPSHQPLCTCPHLTLSFPVFIFIHFSWLSCHPQHPNILILSLFPPTLC